MINRRHCMTVLAGTAAFPALSNTDYPTRPIKLVVPFGPGSPTDMLSRIFMPPFSEKLGQPLILDLKPGAGTSLGAQAVQTSPADGYTLLMGSNATFAVNSVLYKKLPYDPTSFRLVGSVGGGLPSYLVVSSKSKYRTLADYVADAKARPGAVTFASAGVGTTGHMVGELLASAANAELLHVPFKEGAQGFTSTISGEVDGMFYPWSGAKPLVEAGKARVLAVSTLKRTAELPNVPTIAESGYLGFDYVGWGGLAVPKATPQPVYDKLLQALESVHKMPGFVRKLEELGLQTTHLSGREFEAFVARERERAVQLAKRAKIQPE